MPTTTPVSTSIEDVTISFHIKNANTTILSYNFLNMTGIIPSDWKLVQEPEITSTGTEIDFENGVSITTSPNNINFKEQIDIKTPAELQFDNVARKYIDILPNSLFQSVGLLIRFIVTFPESDEAGAMFINDTLLKEVVGHSFPDVTTQAQINLVYKIDDYELLFSASPIKITDSNDSTKLVSAILFGGIYTYDLKSLKGDKLLTKVIKIVDEWAITLATFKELVYKTILGRS